MSGGACRGWVGWCRRVLPPMRAASGGLALRRAVHPAIAQRLGQVRGADMLAAHEIGDGAGDAQDAMHGARGQLQGVDGAFEQLLVAIGRASVWTPDATAHLVC